MLQGEAYRTRIPTNKQEQVNLKCFDGDHANIEEFAERYFRSRLKNWHDFHSKEKLKQEYEFQCNLIRANNQVQVSEKKNG